jgi:CheY-like chemotaxis protein
MRSERTQFSILLISDDEHIQRMASWILLESGYYVAVCATSSEALAQSEGLTPDVILFDVRERPQMHAEAQDIRGAFPEARVAAIHAHAGRGGSDIGHLESECHLHAPFDADDLVQCVEDALAASVGAASTHVHA